MQAWQEVEKETENLNKLIETPAQTLNYTNHNKEVLEQFKQTYPDLSTAFEMNPRDASNYLFSILKYVCVGCGKNKVTASNLKFNSYRPDTKCWDCQQ